MGSTGTGDVEASSGAVREEATGGPVGAGHVWCPKSASCRVDLSERYAGRKATMTSYDVGLGQDYGHVKSPPPLPWPFGPPLAGYQIHCT